VNYKDQESLRLESEEGHRLGFDGKVSPHSLFVKERNEKEGADEIASYSS
jgi:hypothetical protein